MGLYLATDDEPTVLVIVVLSDFLQGENLFSATHFGGIGFVGRIRSDWEAEEKGKVGDENEDERGRESKGKIIYTERRKGN